MQQQKLCLKWNNHTGNLVSVLENFQLKDVLVDVTLSCEGHNIKAHRMVLSACSPYFQNLFLENPCQHPIVIINGMKYEDITAILNFMYKGEVNVSHEGLSSFLQAAEALKVKGLAEVCGEKKSTNSNSQENEQVEQARPQRTDTPTKKRNRNRKRSFSDSNRSDEEGAPRKHKEINSPEVHELSGDESYTGDMSSNGQHSNSLPRVPQNVYSRSHQSSSNLGGEEMEDEYEVEPSKLLEQTLTTESVSMNNSASSDNSLRIERIMGNANEMESSSLQEPESPPDIKPIIEYGESSAGPPEGSMLVYNEHSQPGPSNIQDGSLLHDNSHTQECCPKSVKPPIIFSCIQCAFRTTSETEISKHLYVHVRYYKCEICQKKFDYFQCFQKHCKSHVGGKKFVKKAFEHHRFIVTKTLKKGKPLASSEGLNQKGLSSKLLNNTQKPKRESKLLKFSEKSKKESKSTVESSSNTAKSKIKGKSTGENGNKLTSENSKPLYNNINEEPKQEKVTYCCDSCDGIFTNIEHLTMHRKYHHKPNQYFICSICKKRFGDIMAFTQHKNLHSDDESMSNM